MTGVTAAEAAGSGWRAWQLVALVAVPPALVVGLVAGLASASAVVGVVVLVVVGVVVAVAVRRVAPGRALAALGGSPADQVRHARLLNLVDGLAAGAGVRLPDVRVVDAPGLNLAVAGTDDGQGWLVVTQGLVDQLTRMELEGVVATGIAALRGGGLLAATLSAGVGGLAGSRTLPAGRDQAADEAAVALTRYPPGLVAAYKRMEELGTAVTGARPAAAHLWMADPVVPGRPSTTRLSIPARVDALNEL